MQPLALNKSVWRWPLLFGAWTLLALSFAAQFYILSSQAGTAVSWRQAFGGSLGDWYVVAALAWPVVGLARRFTFTRERWPRSLALHLVSAVAFSVAFMALRAFVAQWQGWAAGRPVVFAEAFRPLLVKTWHFNFLIYWIIVAFAQAAQIYRESQERAVRTLELEKRLAEARLMTLQMQLNPHFLFNALNSVATLIHHDTKAADRMLVRLAELLRLTLDNTSAQEIPLRAELALLERYLEIERIRFGDRLSFRVAIPGDLLDVRVPTLVLQPIVENALQHGIGPLARAGLVEIIGRRDGDSLVLEVRDNGRGLPVGQTGRDGIGLSNTRARLHHLYGEQQDLTLKNGESGGVIVTIRLPLQPNQKAASAS